MQRFARYLVLLATCLVSILASLLFFSSFDPGGFHNDGKQPSFQIRGSKFLLHGEPFRIISLHYFRIPRDYWGDRLLRSKALGCNTVQTYVPWNFHEPVPGVFDFEGQHDVAAFLSLVQELGLYVLLRPGPYVCAEWDLGGLPAWLLDPAITGVGTSTNSCQSVSLITKDTHHSGSSLVRKLRTSEPAYIQYVDMWWAQLLPRVRPLLIHNGGPVVMVQLENEYGVRTVARDESYLTHLRSLAVSELGEDTLLYTTDPPTVAYWGGLPDVFHAVDFGPKQWVSLNFFIQYVLNWRSGKTAPLNSEFYTGWFTHWGSPVANTCASPPFISYFCTVQYNSTSAEVVASSLSSMLAYAHNTGSVSLYMAHGGTSFGFWAGCNGEQFDVTSYDYNCPISESGNTGQPGVGGANKFQAIREVIQHATSEQLPELKDEPVQIAYGSVELHAEEALLLHNLDQLHITRAPIQSKHPLPMEEYGLPFGMLAYTKSISCDLLKAGPTVLKFLAYDLTQVYADGVFIAEAWRAGSLSGLPVTELSSFCSHPTDAAAAEINESGTRGAATVQLTLLVASYGRENFFTVGHSSQVQKGVIGDVVLHCNSSISGETSNVTLTDWQVYAMPLIQPGRVLRWPHGEPEESTRDLISSRDRKPFDSRNGGVWRQDAHDDKDKSHHAELTNREIREFPWPTGSSGSKGEKIGEASAQHCCQHGTQGSNNECNVQLKRPEDRIGSEGRTQTLSTAVRSDSLHTMPQSLKDDEFKEENEVGWRMGDQEEKLLSMVKPGERLVHGPAFYRGLFTIAQESSSIQDTFLLTTAWTRGMVWVNGHNLGRFWTSAGPQQTLYVPKSFLLSGTNELVVLELDHSPDTRRLEFVAAPEFSRVANFGEKQ